MQKIKTGIASFGLSGRVFHAPFITAHGGFELKLIVERSKNIVKDYYPNVKTVRSFDELIQSDVELIVVNTPDETHYEYCKQALLAGKHIVVEKPFVATLAEAQELVALAQHKKLMLTVYQNRRYDNDFLTLKQILNSGELGRVVEFQSNFERYRPQVPQQTWKELPNRKGGIVYDLCSHLIDQAVALFGRPTTIWAVTDKQRDGAETNDYCLLELKYPGLIATLRAGCLIREQSARLVIHGTKGSYVKYGIDPQEDPLRNDEAKPTLEDWISEDESMWGILNSDLGRRPYPTLNGNYVNYYKAIYNVLRSGGELPVSHADMLTDISILEAALQSSETGCAVTLTP